MRKRQKLVGALFGVGVVGVALGYLLWGGIGQNLVYFLTPSELAARESAVGAGVRLGGMVEVGSVRWNAETTELRFRLTDGDTSIDVLSRGAPPQMFTEGIGVVVEGALTAGGLFESHNLMVKHSNEYRAPPPGEHPAQYYKELFQDQGT
jgi:cytochrome c-type biogenesis protein CcmE